MSEDFSNEGLYRLLEKMDREHGDDLKEIRRQTTLTNSRVAKLESRAERSDQELKRLNSAVFPHRENEQTERWGESVSLRLSPKIWTALAAGGGLLFAMLIEWAKRRLETP